MICPNLPHKYCVAYPFNWQNFFCTGQAASLHWRTDLQCSPSPTSIIPNNGTEVTYALRDSNLTTCLVPSEKAADHLQIRFPVITSGSLFRFILIGRNLHCSPIMGLTAIGIGCDDDGACRNSLCIPRDLNNFQGGAVCEYRCHCSPTCTAVVLEITGVSDVAHTWQICEITAWILSIPLQGDHKVNISCSITNIGH